MDKSLFDAFKFHEIFTFSFDTYVSKAKVYKKKQKWKNEIIGEEKKRVKRNKNKIAFILAINFETNVCLHCAIASNAKVHNWSWSLS